MLVIDDALLLAVLADRVPTPLAYVSSAAASGELFTTGCWFWRLGRALARPSTGALSRAMAALAEAEQVHLKRALEELPEQVGLLGLRRLVPIMSALPGQVNLLTAEAVAAAALLGAEIVVSTESDLLDATARMVGVAVRHAAWRP